MKKLQHLHILVKALINNPKVLDSSGLERWVRDTVVDQGLAPVIGPHVVYVYDEGNEGPTGGVNIKTSHMAFHIWDKQGVMQADLYTCGDLDIEKFLNAFTIFEPVQIQYMVLDRAEGFQMLEAGTIK